MSERLASVLFCLIMLIPIGVFARQIQRVRRGTQRKLEGALSFVSYSLLPVLAYALVFLVLVGVEALTTLPVITEGLARTLLPVVGLGLAEVLLLAAIFAIAVWLVRVPGHAA